MEHSAGDTIIFADQRYARLAAEPGKSRRDRVDVIGDEQSGPLPLSRRGLRRDAGVRGHFLQTLTHVASAVPLVSYANSAYPPPTCSHTTAVGPGATHFAASVLPGSLPDFAGVRHDRCRGKYAEVYDVHVGSAKAHPDRLLKTIRLKYHRLRIRCEQTKSLTKEWRGRQPVTDPLDLAAPRVHYRHKGRVREGDSA